MDDKTCWLTTQDKFSKMMHCDVQTSRASPVQFISCFLSTHAPSEATNECVPLDQGGELHGLPQMLKSSEENNQTVLPTAPDAPNKSPFEWCH